MPDLIRYYLSEEPILPNVPTFRCEEPAQLSHVVANLDRMVVKPANESGQALRPLQVAAGPVEGVGRAAQEDRLAHVPPPASPEGGPTGEVLLPPSTIQVSFEPPPWDELTT